MSLSPPSGAPPTAASQRSSLGLHVDKEGASVSAGDADNKSIKSECLLPKELSRTARRLGPAVACYSSESSLATPDSWSYSLPIRPFKVDSGSVSKVSPMEGACPLLHPRARADGKEEVDSERVYGPLEFIKLPYDPPRSAMTGADSRDCVKLSTPNFSNGSMKSSAEINLLRHELEVARQKVATLTSQLEA
uniref:Uncharacterized protein n=1 Tax=Mesocestoides corti TaxID=53468 RepID=A0A5K3FBG6_MESCO